LVAVPGLLWFTGLLLVSRPWFPKESIFAGGMWQHMLWVGITMGAVTLFAQAWAIHLASSHWQTMVFTVLTLAQMGHVLAIRGLTSNLPLLGAVGLTFLLQFGTIYIPYLEPYLQYSAAHRCRAFLLLALVNGGVLCRGSGEVDAPPWVDLSGQPPSPSLIVSTVRVT
jgi:hypothetical protein